MLLNQHGFTDGIMFSFRDCLVLLLIIAFSSQTHANSQESETVWRFKGRDGAIEIKLTRSTNQYGKETGVLEIYSPDGTPRTANEEAVFLKAVLTELPKKGLAPQALWGVLFRFNEPDAVAKVAECAAASNRWKSSLKTKSIPIVYDVVTSFLNDCGPYDEWKKVFNLYGLIPRVAGVEEVILGPFSKTNGNCPQGQDCRGVSVPVDAFVQMNLAPMAKN